MAALVDAGELDGPLPLNFRYSRNNAYDIDYRSQTERWLKFHLDKTLTQDPIATRLARIVAVPHWLLALCLGVLPAKWLLAYRRTRSRVSLGFCPTCGYDLRAHAAGGRCPECGSLVSAKEST
jgi:hypothetical protein